MKKIFSIVFIIFLSACSTMKGPSQEQIDTADYGMYPENYENLVNEHYVAMLDDPSSAIIESIGEPQKEYLYDHKYHTDFFIGYVVCVTLNTKNAYGNYTGKHTDGLLIKNGRVLHTLEGGYWERRAKCTG